MSYKKLSPRQKRKIRIRKKITGTTERPRLSVFRSNRYLYAQIIDDVKQATLVSANTLSDEKGANKEAAAKLGKELAEKATQQNIKLVSFDRSGYQYHGVIKELAGAARKAGLEF
ncbi:MAG: 50S ribosomal protein L18 [bacterium]|nr:50S ribosomal protein L18 [bacterium]MBU1919134.1 50S ribosomal protein L18 [bacterium]